MITSPPYWGLRDYGVEGQLGLESHPQEYIDKLVLICKEIRRVLKKSGSFYLNLGDTYCGGGVGQKDTGKAIYSSDIFRKEQFKDFDNKWLQPKQLMLIPSRVAIALQNDGWILRNDIIWHKPNPMPSSVKDRLNNTFEHVFHFVKSRKYYYDLDAIREPHKWAEKDKRSLLGRVKGKTGKITTGSYSTNAVGYNPNGKNPGDVVKDLQEKRGYKRSGMARLASHEFDTPGTSGLYHKDGKNPGDFWNITTQPFTGYNPELEHFAVFPEDLVLKPLKASCPKEICKKCGKPRMRIVKAEQNKTQSDYRRDGRGILGRKENQHCGLSGYKNTEYQTIGFSDCGCNAGFNSGIVLDPFCGRGTVGKVAKSLGLNYILFDIKPEYCELARLFIAGQKNKVHKDQSKLL